MLQQVMTEPGKIIFRAAAGKQFSFLCAKSGTGRCW